MVAVRTHWRWHKNRAGAWEYEVGPAFLHPGRLLSWRMTCLRRSGCHPWLCLVPLPRWCWTMAQARFFS